MHFTGVLLLNRSLNPRVSSYFLEEIGWFERLSFLGDSCGLAVNGEVGLCSSSIRWIRSRGRMARLDESRRQWQDVRRLHC